MVDLNLQECETYTTFDYGLQAASLIADSDYIWCVSGKDGGSSLAIRSVHDNKDEAAASSSSSLPFHQFGIGTGSSSSSSSSDQYTILTGKDFEYEQQKYLLLSLEVTSSSSSSNKKRYQLVVFKLSVSRVMLAFQLPYRPTKLDVLVSNAHYIPCRQRNPSFLGNMSVCAVVGCAGGYVCMFDVTPSDVTFGWLSNEYSPLDVYWHPHQSAVDLTDYDEIQRAKKSHALSKKKVFGLLLNSKFISDNYFRYSMPNETVTASIPSDYVRVSSLQYEKKLDSLLVGFNFGCFQMWNMKTMSIESSSGYGENNKPVVGFSVLQPQNDPKKCVFLMVAHSSAILATEDKSQALKNCQSPPSIMMNRTNQLSHSVNKSDPEQEEQELDDDEFEIDNDDDDDSDSSFILLYQLVYERSVNVFQNQNNSYTLYEGLNYCVISFEHEFTFETLRCIKTNYSNEVDATFYTAAHNSTSNIGGGGGGDHVASSHSKIVSIQTLSVMNNRLQTDLGCIIWSLVDSAASYFYLSIFNLNNWYVQCMPSKMRPLTELDSVTGSVNKIRRNIYFTNYTLSVNADLDSIKAMSVVDSKVKHIHNQNALSCGNVIMQQLGGDEQQQQTNTNDDDEEEELKKSMGYESNLEDDTYLSMYFDVLVISAFFCLKISIKPIEQQIHNVISKQEDLIHHPDKVYSLLLRYHLLDKYVSNNKHHTGQKFIPIFDYLLETAQIYPILKSLWKLKDEDTSILSDYSLKAVLDWSWSKVARIKTETNNLYKLTSILVNNHINDFTGGGQSEIQSEHLHELFQRQNNLLESLIQIFKQFIKLDTTSEGRVELNKKLCVVESLKCYIEHLGLFHKYDLLIPPPLRSRFVDHHNHHNRNYIKEMNVNFKIIHNKWKKRRQSNSDEIVNVITSASSSSNENENNNKYPFTYMIDCIVEECKLYSNTAKLFNESLVYPPRTINDLLEICLECNLSTRMKQIIILYVLCDLMHTELSPDVQKYVLKVINAYCATPFTLMSNSLDKDLRERTSGGGISTSIISNGQISGDSHQQSQQQEQFSCLFDLVNGLYLVDVRQLDKSFKYMRATDCSYLEFYEKYFILYNSAHCEDFKSAVQYLWLFQKLNANSLGSADLTTVVDYMSQHHRMNTVGLGESNLFHFLNKSKSLNLVELNKDQTCGYEQRMHFRLTITIYLANSLVNEAYDLMKPHIRHLKSWFNVNNLNVKLSKELIVHFFAEAERFDQWKKVIKLSSLDNELLLVLLSYLEAKQDLKSICIAIELQLNSRSYKRASELYDKYSKQILASAEFKYLAQMIEIAKSMQSVKDENGVLFNNKQVWLISPADIKDTLGFQYRFTTSLRELAKKSKRCMKFLDSSQDSDYVNLLKLPVINLPSTSTESLVGCPATPTTSHSLLASLASSHLKRKASTPHPFAPGIRDSRRKIMQLSPQRLLTSSLKHSRPASSDAAANTSLITNSKSVKFKLAEFTKRGEQEDDDLNGSSFINNKSADKSSLADMENDEPTQQIDEQQQDQVESSDATATSADLKGKRLDFGEREDDDDDNRKDVDYQPDVDLVNDNDGGDDEEMEQSMITRSKKARQSSPSPKKKSPSPVKQVEPTKTAAAAAASPSPKSSPLGRKSTASPRRKGTPTMLCAETLNCLNETFESQEEINAITAAAAVVVNSTAVSANEDDESQRQRREEEEEEERLARSNFQSETDNEYLTRLNYRKTIRLSGLDQTESADSHRSTTTITTTTTQFYSTTEVRLTLPTRPSNDNMSVTTEAAVKTEIVESDDHEEEEEEQEDDHTSAMDISDHRAVEVTEAPLVEKTPSSPVQEATNHVLKEVESTNIEPAITEAPQVEKIEVQEATNNTVTLVEVVEPTNIELEEEKQEEMEEVIASTTTVTVEVINQIETEEQETTSETTANIENIDLVGSTAPSAGLQVEEEVIESQVTSVTFNTSTNNTQEAVATSSSSPILVSSSSASTVVAPSKDATAAATDKSIAEREVEEEEIMSLHSSMNNTTSSSLRNDEEQDEEMNDSGDLNMSSISSRMVNDETPTQSPDKQQSMVQTEYTVTSTLTAVSAMTRTNSEWSLYSEISSVSQRPANTKQTDSQNNTLTNEDDLDETATSTTSKRRQSNIKRRAPVRGGATSRRTMEIKLEKRDDDNKDDETASNVGDDDDDRASVASRVSLRRRRSDASSIASSTTSAVKEPIVATEKKMTRGRKLKSLVELPASDLLPTLLPDTTASSSSTTTAKVVTRRNSSKKTATADSSAAAAVVATPVIMSASNLKKYNAIMEEQDQQQETTGKRPTTRRGVSRASRSPSASSIVSATSSVTSSIASSLRPRRVASTRQAKKPVAAEKTIICCDDDDDETEKEDKNQVSPSNSVISIASSVASTGRRATTTTRRNNRKIKEEEITMSSVKKETDLTTPKIASAAATASQAASVNRSNSSRNYNLRSKFDTPKVEATLNVDDSCDSETYGAGTTSSTQQTSSTQGSTTTNTRVPTLRRGRTARGGGGGTIKKEPSNDMLPDL